MGEWGLNSECSALDVEVAMVSDAEGEINCNRAELG